ncbi:MAG: 16S rRNA processing protein RimM, partial [Chloroflexi bacterium]|nr:16S rRNA processing protein RimM [Chloroflexota bacterium]
LEVPEGDLAPLSDGQYYRFQIVGLAVFDVEGQKLGHVERVLDTGANDVYLVQDEESELLIPAIDSVVKEIDVAGGRMVVEPLAGLERRPLARPKQR